MISGMKLRKVLNNVNRLNVSSKSGTNMLLEYLFHNSTIENKLYFDFIYQL